MHRANLTFEGIFNSLGFPLVWNDAEHICGLKNLADRHGDCRTRNFLQTVEPSLTNLLPSTSLIELNDNVRLLRFKIGRRIVECQMAVLTDPDKRDIDRARRYRSSHAPAL